MERESFESEAIAEILNRHFISIKVDREERPDIDAIYMKVCQAMTGGGGWPLTIIMTPEKNPFFAGTYLPPDDRRAGQYGMKGMSALLTEVAELWAKRRADIDSAAEKIVKALNRPAAQAPEFADYTQALHSAYNVFATIYDETYGGFSDRGPKFPTPHNFSFLLRYWKRSGNANALKMTEKGLSAIAAGGIRDHLGGGFARYSTDRKWLVPHFEKMLYDQALLARAYLEAYQATGDESYSEVAVEIFEYALRDMTSPEGAFYSAEDADSEGVEGKFYVWKESEIDRVLSGDEREIFKSYYGATKAGNFENGENILHIPVPEKKFLANRGVGKESLKRMLDSAKARLLKERAGRTRPHLDDKILVSWNGLMISSLALGTMVLGDKKYALAAAKAASFIEDKMIVNGVLQRRRRDGESATPAFLDDYAFLASGYLDLYEAGFDPAHLLQAIKLADYMIENFGDDINGGFFLSSRSHEKLLTDIKEAFDGAEPSGNSVAAELLFRLGRYTENEKYTDAALKTIKSFSGDLEKAPYASSRMLCAIDFYLGPPLEIVVAGNPSSPEAEKLIRASNSVFLPNAVRAVSEGGGGSLENIIPMLKDKKMSDGNPALYVCKNRTCGLPITNPSDFKSLVE